MKAAQKSCQPSAGPSFQCATRPPSAWERAAFFRPAPAAPLDLEVPPVLLWCSTLLRQELRASMAFSGQRTGAQNTVAAPLCRPQGEVPG